MGIITEFPPYCNPFFQKDYIFVTILSNRIFYIVVYFAVKHYILSIFLLQIGNISLL